MELKIVESIAYEKILSISDCLFVKLINEFVFSDAEPTIINFL